MKKLGVSLLGAMFFSVAAAAAAQPTIDDISILDRGDDSTHGLSVDVTKTGCEAEQGEEPFNSTLARLTVHNPKSSSFRITSYRIKVGSLFQSGRISTLLVVSPDQDGTVDVLLTSVAGSDKYFPGDDTPISASSTLRNVRFTLFGRLGTGQKVKVSAKLGLAFVEQDRCSE